MYGATRRYKPVSMIERWLGGGTYRAKSLALLEQRKWGSRGNGRARKKVSDGSGLQVDLNDSQPAGPAPTMSTSTSSWD